MAWLGWISSSLLLCTIIYQVRNHWRSDDNGGVSIVLYVGQFLASLGFLGYSLSVGNWVFVVTNSALAMAGVAGLLIYRHHEKAGDSLSIEEECGGVCK